jgi:hypothetical protein
MATTKPAFKTLADFQAAHNPDVKIPAKIKAGLTALLAEGKESAEYETDFCKRAGVSIAHIGKYRDLFTKHIVPVKPEGHGTSKNVWFADASIAAKARG